MNVNKPPVIPLVLHDTTLKRHKPLPDIVRYALAVCFTGLGLLLSLAFSTYLESGRFIIFAASVMLSVWFGGIGPGLLSAALSVIIADYFIIQPYYILDLSPNNALQFVIFLGVAGLITLLEARRQRSERILDERTNWLQTIVNSLGDGIVVRNEQGDILMVNQPMIGMMGYSQTEASKAISENAHRVRFSLFDEQGKPISYSVLQSPLVFEQGQTTEVTVRGHNNETHEDKWYVLKTSPVRDEQGDVHSSVSISRDVTEQRRTQQIEIDGQKRIADLLNNMPVFASLLSPQGEVIEVNQMALNVIRLQAVDVLGKPVDQLAVWSNVDPLRQTLSDALQRAAKGETVHFETTLDGTENQKIEIEVTIAPISESDGRVKYLVVTGIDVTEQKKKEQELQDLNEELDAQRSRLQLVLDNVPGLIWEVMLNPTGKPNIFVNDYAKQMLGYEKSAWEESLNFWDTVVHSDDREQVNMQARTILQNDGHGRLELRCVHKDGRVIPVEVHTSVMKAEDGQIIGLCGVFMDITERKRYETQLANQAEALRRSNADLERFVSIASHDLQEPLRTITSFIQLIDERNQNSFTPETKEFMGFVVDGTARMKALITDLLAFSRAKNAEMIVKSVELNTVLDKVLTNLQTAIDESGAKIAHPTLPTVQGNATQLTQLFQNLLGNAIKFRRDVPPEVSIEVKQEPKEWVFQIKDNGIGIENQYLDRIFILFERLHSRHQYPGTGLGLAICKQIVENHHGRLWAESTINVGTTFYFTLPIQPEAVPQKG